jgi:hypothetical protein
MKPEGKGQIKRGKSNYKRQFLTLGVYLKYIGCFEVNSKGVHIILHNIQNFCDFLSFIPCLVIAKVMLCLYEAVV